MLRDGMAPIIGIESMRSYLTGQNAWSDRSNSLLLNVLKNDVSKSGEFGYTYGTYQIEGKSGVVDKGCYLHVWRRDDAGRWRVVAGTAQSTLESQ
jgi:ketosteroid isomerase-like protein